MEGQLAQCWLYLGLDILWKNKTENKTKQNSRNDTIAHFIFRKCFQRRILKRYVVYLFWCIYMWSSSNGQHYQRVINANWEKMAGTKWKYAVSASHRKFKGGAGGRGGCHSNCTRMVVAHHHYLANSIFWHKTAVTGRITKALSHELVRGGPPQDLALWPRLTLFRFQSGFQVDGFAFLLRSLYTLTI